MTTNQIRLQIAEKSAGSLNFPPGPGPGCNRAGRHHHQRAVAGTHRGQEEGLEKRTDGFLLSGPRHWGPGAFVISAYGMGNFEEALKRKLVLEILAGSDQARFR